MIPKYLQVLGLVAAVVLVLIFTDSMMIAVVAAFFSVFFLVRIMHGLLPELIISGAFLTLIASYHFYFQKVYSDFLPAFNDYALIFIGTFAVLRSIIAFTMLIPVPILSSLIKGMTGK